ncbi:hypothetical protein LWC34_38995 [Kibdelosporangium philippinense]|uniref:Uncharacterized protein n=1 Tax=Kibdelosporangium philippinense TaxID=211113 RepID=A0ABS8ZNI0_9PSEU|nr:hypothetical protein [Kibdelosporangium philippinense]MCE7008758.1 hypothetical protein [Kibdelosporangium philippinense]
MTLILAGSAAVILSFAQANQVPPEMALVTAAAMPIRHAYLRHARPRLQLPMVALSRLIGWCARRWRVGLAVLVAVDVVLGVLVLVRDGHDLAALAVLSAALLGAVGRLAWLWTADR